MSIKVDKIELCMGPTQLGAPDDLKQVIVNFIDGARKKLDIAVQELDCRDIAKAIGLLTRFSLLPCLYWCGRVSKGTSLKTRFMVRGGDVDTTTFYCRAPSCGSS